MFYYSFITYYIHYSVFIQQFSKYTTGFIAKNDIRPLRPSSLYYWSHTIISSVSDAVEAEATVSRDENMIGLLLFVWL